MPAHRGGLRRRRDGRCGCADRSALPGQRADRRVTAGYDGPVVDAFLHTPWLGGDVPADPRGDKGRLARRPHAWRASSTSSPSHAGNSA